MKVLLIGNLACVKRFPWKLMTKMLVNHDLITGNYTNCS